MNYCPVCGKSLWERDVSGRRRLCCPECDFVYWRNPVAAAGALVGFGEGVLLARRKYEPRAGEWSIPGGYVECGETVEEAAVREMLEETGLDIRLEGLLGVYSDRGPAVRVIYRAAIAGGSLCPGDDITEARFFDVGTLPEKVAFATDRMALDDWLKAKGAGGLPIL
ncbi:MAG: NUDIX domain-containing protein [Armatimonadetes bacterium]|nr:NUDIX domain-containing protein [Armatimonadota bacterium]